MPCLSATFSTPSCRARRRRTPKGCRRCACWPATWRGCSGPDCGEQQLHVALDDAVGHKLFLFLGLFGGEGIGKFFGAEFGDGLFQNLLVGLIAEVGDETALLGAEQVAGTADVEILHGDIESRTQI